MSQTARSAFGLTAKAGVIATFPAVGYLERWAKERRYIAMMRIRIVILGFLGFWANGFCLSYFGDIDANRLVIKLKAIDSLEASRLGCDLPTFVVLHNGQPVLSKDASPTEKSIVSRGKLDILNLVEYNPDTMKPKQGGNRYLLFTFPTSGWNEDQYETVIRIPYTVDQDDNKQMLRISSKAIAETRWRDPKNKHVTVVSYWSNLGVPCELKVTVLENTLGFANTLPPKQSTIPWNKGKDNALPRSR